MGILSNCISQDTLVFSMTLMEDLLFCIVTMKRRAKTLNPNFAYNAAHTHTARVLGKGNISGKSGFAVNRVRGKSGFYCIGIYRLTFFETAKIIKIVKQ